MESQSARSFDFVSGLEQVRTDFLARRLVEARELGFKTVDELERHEAAQEDSAGRSERAVRDLRRRERACAAAHGRITDAVRVQILHGEPLPTTKAVEAVDAWRGGKKPILVISGGTGCGKTVSTVLAMAACSERVQFVRAIRIGAHFERWGSDRDDKIPALDMDCGLLVVDDLGQELVEDRRTMPALEEIVDYRQSLRTRTIFTTNLTPAQIKERYSERFRSRLTQNAELAQVEGSDLRRAR